MACNVKEQSAGLTKAPVTVGEAVVSTEPTMIGAGDAHDQNVQTRTARKPVITPEKVVEPESVLSPVTVCVVASVTRLLTSSTPPSSHSVL